MDAGWLPLRGAGTPKEHKIQGCVTPNHHSPAAPELPSRGADAERKSTVRTNFCGERSFMKYDFKAVEPNGKRYGRMNTPSMLKSTIPNPSSMHW